MEVHQDILDEVAKLKKPYLYYLYKTWRVFLTVLCCAAALGVVGVLIGLAIDKWFSDIKQPVLFILFFIVPILAIISIIGNGIVAIWKWGVTNKLKESSLTNRRGYYNSIRSITNSFYDKWETNTKTVNEKWGWLDGWKKTFVELPYNRAYPTDEREIKKVKIPLFYNDNFYSKADYKQILSELNIDDGEQLIYDIINPTVITSQDFIDCFSERFDDCIITRNDNNTIRFTVVSKDGVNNFIFLAQYKAINDIEDLCSSSFLESLIPSKKVSIIAFQKEFTREELLDECEHRRKVAIFNDRLETLQQELANWNRLIGYPYYYFYNYYPTSMSQIGKENEQIRELIFNFKDSTPQNRAAVLYNPYPKIPMSAFYRGIHASITKQQKKAARFRDAFNFMVNKVSEKISKTIGCDAASQVSFVCIPCGSEKDTRDRLEDFYRLVCERTGMDNAYQYVHGVGDDTPKHLGGVGLIDIILDKTYFAGKKVVVFDDIVTRGTTMRKMVDALENCGATVLFIITIARTTHHLSAHPIDSDPIFNETII